MTFNPDADLSRNTTRLRGRTAALAGGSGVGPLLRSDLSGLVGGAPGGGSEPAGGSAIENCDSGADANANVDCRMAGAQLALDAFWEDNVEG